MSEFTQGKWKSDVMYNGHIIVFVDRHIIADCFENEADARLISAAPKLYELLFNLFNVAEYISPLDIEDTRREWRELLTRIDGRDE